MGLGGLGKGGQRVMGWLGVEGYHTSHLTYPSAEGHRLLRGRQVSMSFAWGCLQATFSTADMFQAHYASTHTIAHEIPTGKYSYGPRLRFLLYKVL